MKKHTQISGLILLLLGLVTPCVWSSPDELHNASGFTANIENGKKIYPLCASCHLDNGWGKKDGSFPVLAGQHPKVLLKQLHDIRSRGRENPTMYPFADPKSIGGEQAVVNVTAYIATLPPCPNPGKGDGSQLDTGKKIYQQQCRQCHGDSAQGNNDALLPRLKGQHHAYLLRQLKAIRDGYRQNSNPVMVNEVKKLKDDELDAVADYVSRL